MGLTRLLVPKADVVRALRKRLVDMDRPERKNGLLGMYFDDIFDHIASLLAQLQERETSLKYTHSSFFARVSMISIRFQIHIATVITLATMVIDIVFFITLFCTTFSMNLNIPADNQFDDLRPHEPMYDNLRAFAGIASSLVVFPFFLVLLLQIRCFSFQSTVQTINGITISTYLPDQFGNTPTHL